MVSKSIKDAFRISTGLSWLCIASFASAAPAPAQAPENAGKKVYGRTLEESPPPSWPRPVKARAGAPNVLVIMTDDVGFGAASAFGGPIPTPTFDALAKSGLRYTAFHTTAICSPTRASLLTGRYPHNVGMGDATDIAAGYDGYTTVIPRSAGTVAQILKQNGYNTAMFGKGHITPRWEQGPMGPFDRWPTGLGFEYFYGFIGADVSMFEPMLVENTWAVHRSPGDPNYHFDRDLADHAVNWIRTQRQTEPDKPFFIYYATGTAHAPSMAPKEWLARFKGKFDQGWDAARAQTFARQKTSGVIPADAVLTPRPALLPAWSSLSTDQKRLCARFMEAYAASLAFADEQIGRVIESLRATSELENTLVMFIQGDNGATAEGGINGMLFEQSQINGLQENLSYQLTRIDDIGSEKVYAVYPAAWGWAMNTPFQYYKRVASHLGGIRNGLVISWPKHIADAGAIRPQFHHVSDIVPTILDAAAVEAPAMLDGVPQQPMDGISMAYTFEGRAALSRRTTQVFEMMNNYAIYSEGWMASTRPTIIPWDLAKSPKSGVNERTWELYDLNTDFSQSRDVAATHQGKLQQMQQLFWAEAARNNILPIHDLRDGREGAPDPLAGRSLFSYSPGFTRLPWHLAPPPTNRSFSITADVVIPESGARGVLVTKGGRFGGYAFYLHDGRLTFFYNALDPSHARIESREAVSAGTHKLTADFQSETNGTATVKLLVDGHVVASGRIERTLRSSHSEGFDVGEDTITPINDDYTIAGSRFTGELRELTIAVK